MNNFIKAWDTYLLEGIIDTIYMVGWSTVFAVLIGFILAIILVITDKEGLRPNKIIYRLLDITINVFRSFPFIILIVAVIPVTRFIVGKAIGNTAAIVPLTIGAAPFVARIIESSLKEVDKGIIEAAKSFGASNFQIIFRVMIKEAVPSIVRGITLSIISLIGYAAMAGAIGAKGLGYVAIQIGYSRFDNALIFYTVVILILLVQGIQIIGDLLYKKLK
ncbi:methionine ABC transporter permease [Clostridium cellulovorans]|uniref:Binding-protein-dependent transport systems inner membrane component n=1 Tax=Clostridium cellulovorans (strain ATCC 35296 / DSM 3052 / OCM 3 / 743B) TaxID=573061 RepID=D9SRE7_CLOC7|nr:methionine ABC transporter permease [Clostridium cellulovorans]ADL52376.1 binding-protein-dependent transport systems inner membrane component [Clostridium cellulovorans 743B]